MIRDFESFPLTRKRNSIDTTDFDFLRDLQLNEQQWFAEDVGLKKLRGIARALSSSADFHLTIRAVGADDPKGAGFRIVGVVKHTRNRRAKLSVAAERPMSTSLLQG